MIKIRIVNNTYANNMNHTKFIASPKVQVHFAKYIKEKNTTCGIETAVEKRTHAINDQGKVQVLYLH